MAALKAATARPADSAPAGAEVGSLSYLVVDLASLASVKAAVAAFLAQHPALHLLINNAGCGLCAHSQTEEGFEIQAGFFDTSQGLGVGLGRFGLRAAWAAGGRGRAPAAVSPPLPPPHAGQIGTNHFGTVLLTELLLPRLLECTPSRVVFVGRRAANPPQKRMKTRLLRRAPRRCGAAALSLAPPAVACPPRLPRSLALNFPNTPRIDWADLGGSKITAGITKSGSSYGTSKLYIALYQQHLQSRFGGKGLTAFCTHPGSVNTSLPSKMGTGFLRCCLGGLMNVVGLNLEKGARGTLFCATAPLGAAGAAPGTRGCAVLPRRALPDRVAAG